MIRASAPKTRDMSFRRPARRRRLRAPREDSFGYTQVRDGEREAVPTSELGKGLAGLACLSVRDVTAEGVLDQLCIAATTLVPGATAAFTLIADPYRRRPPDRPTAVRRPDCVTFEVQHQGVHLAHLDLRLPPGADLSQEALEAMGVLLEVAAAAMVNVRAYADLVAAMEQTRDTSLHDPLTGLPNRVLLVDRIDQALTRSGRLGQLIAVFFADLDRFKRVNDLYGHRVGDELLVAFAVRLQEALRPGDTAARLAGDEFVVLCENLKDESEAHVIAARLRSALRAPFKLSTGTISMSASVGIAFAGHAGAVSEQLLGDADAAMYQAKRRGGGRHQVLDLRERHHARDRAILEEELRGAWTRAEMRPLYQPIVRSVDGAPAGVEVLLRWTSPRRGPIAPSAFIPVAEQTGMINEIGRWVLEQACMDRQQWASVGRARLDLSVNVSARQLMSPDYVTAVASVLDATRTDPALVTLEITEDVFLHDSDRALVVLEDLKSLGTTIALDDFGTGYSSMSYLKRFPVDIVKIDRSFVADLGTSPESHAIVYAIVELAHLLGMVVVAEGVESADQHHEVTMLGCDLSQGFHFAHPMEAGEVCDVMRRGSLCRRR